MYTDVVFGSKDIFATGETANRHGWFTEGADQRHLGRHLDLAIWDSFTLGVWTTASGSLHEVESALELIMTNQSMFIE